MCGFLKKNKKIWDLKKKAGIIGSDNVSLLYIEHFKIKND